MVQKQQPRPRGRPRAYDPDVALAQVMDTFWNAGYAGTSLDDLSAATGMNRPSLYGAFGDKRALYLKALERYRARGRAALKETLALDQPLRQALRQVYAKALAVYLSGEGSARLFHDRNRCHRSGRQSRGARLPGRDRSQSG